MLKHIALYSGLLTLAGSLAAFELDFTDSGKKLKADHEFRLRGQETSLTPEGLKVSGTDLKKPGGAVTIKKYPDMLPSGAFEFEAEFKLLPDIQAERKGGRFFLWDNRYTLNTKPNAGKTGGGFMVYLEKNRKNYKVTALFGLAEKTAALITAEDLPAGDGKPHSLKIRFDPSGWHELYFDGALKVKKKTGLGKLAPTGYPAVIGDRYGSIFGPLGGVIRKIRLEPAAALKLAPIDFISRKYGSRRVFVRREKNSGITIEFTNTTGRKQSGTVRGTLDGLNGSVRKDFSADPEQKSRVFLPVETNLLPGKYELKVEFAGGDGKPLGRGNVIITIVPEFTETLELLASDHFYSPELMDKIHTLGITHVHNILSVRRGKLTQHIVDRSVELLDLHLEHGLRCDDKPKITQRYLREGKHLLLNRDGKPYPRKCIDAADEEVYRDAVGAIRDAAKALGNHPAWDRIYPNNELRDGSAISYSKESVARVKAAGLEIPKNASGRLPVIYSSNPRMPWNRIVPVSDPEYRFWRWFWTTGDGWDKLNGDAGDAVRQVTGRQDFISDFAPATRSLPYLGIGGKVNMLSTWTYCDPDPLKLGQTTDELLAAADGKKAVAVGNQGIWYRNRTAPEKIKVTYPPEWLARDPGAKYISPAPDMLREGFWIAVSRKIAHLDTHGQGSWLRPMPTHRYRYTNPGVTQVYPEFMNTVGKPLGPALIKVDEVTPEVMILQSFTNALYGGGHTWGWGDGWTADLHLALQWAHIQAGFCYEEHLLRGDLDNGKVKVLILPSCRVLNDQLLAKIRELQNRGVCILADEFLNIALLPDFRIKAVIRDKADAEKSKRALQELGLEIRKKLAPVLTPCFDSASQDLVLRRRASGEAAYIFAVNDKRTYGNYVGQWKRVMEKGLPLSAEFTASIPCSAAYDLVNHRAMPYKRTPGKTAFKLNLKPGSGAIIILLPRPVASIRVNAPDRIKRGSDYVFEFTPVDAAGKAFRAVLPLEVRFTCNGRTLPGTGFYATDINGKFILKDTAALNLPEGKAVVSVKCLASGRAADKEITLQK